MRVAYLMTVLLTQSIPAAAENMPLVLRPTSTWNLRYDEDKCRMLRQFGEGEQNVILMLDQSGIEPYYTLSLIGQPASPNNGEYMLVKFGDEEATKRSFVHGELEDETPLIAMHGVNLAPVPPLKDEEMVAEIEPIGQAREAAIDRIAFSTGLDDPLTLETGSLGEPLAAMRQCSVDLGNYLGSGEGSSARLSQRALPKNNPGSWVTTADYPTAMINRDEEGTVRFRLTVDNTGKATACHITRSTRPQIFDDVVCLALLKRAKFEPALDLHGKPTASYWHSAVRFAIPN